MNYILFILGIIICLTVLVDLIWSSLWVDGGAGPITNIITNSIWYILRKFDKKGKGVLTLSGPLILILTLFTWIILLWFGWALIFLSIDGALVNTAREDPASTIDHFYYTGYVIFNLGNGEFTPTTHFVKILTSLASGFGLLNLSLAISYIMSIADGVVKRRAFASSISGLGKSSEEIVKSTWDGKNFIDTSLIFHSLANQLSEISFQQKAYPLLNYYHTSDKYKSISYTLPVLDNTVSILEYAIDNDSSINTLMAKNIRSTIDDYMESISRMDENEYKNQEALDYPDLGMFSGLDLDLIDQKEFNKYLDEMEPRRRRISTLMKVNWPNEEK